jgi:hypothetical protein
MDWFIYKDIKNPDTLHKQWKNPTNRKKSYFYKKLVMKSFLLKYSYQILLICIGLAWIAFLNALLQIKNQHIIYPDSDNYREAADFFYHNFKAHYYRPLGMAAIFGLPYLFGGNDASVYEFSFIVNVLSWLGSALLLFSFLKRYLSANMALTFTLLFYTILGSAFITFHLLTESIYIFLILSVFYFIDRYYRTTSFNYLAFALSVLLFTMLIKPGAKFLAIVLLLFFSRVLVKNYYRRSTILIYISFGLVLFQCLKVKEEYGNFTTSYIDGVTYYNYLGTRAICLKTDAKFDQADNERSNYIFSLPYPETKTVAGKDFAEQLKSNKVNLLKAYFLNILDNTKTPDDCITICRNIDGSGYFEPVKKAMIIISKYQNRLFTCIGCILAFYFFFRSFKKPDIYTLISFYILYTIAISGISSQQGDRFHMVFFPFVIILAGKFYAGKYQKNILPNQ